MRLAQRYLSTLALVPNSLADHEEFELTPAARLDCQRYQFPLDSLLACLLLLVGSPTTPTSNAYRCVFSRVLLTWSLFCPLIAQPTDTLGQARAESTTNGGRASDKAWLADNLSNSSHRRLQLSPMVPALDLLYQLPTSKVAPQTRHSHWASKSWLGAEMVAAWRLGDY